VHSVVCEAQIERTKQINNQHQSESRPAYGGKLNVKAIISNIK